MFIILNIMNIVLITSVCYTPNIPFTYIATRSVFSHEERFTQLLSTIKSVRDNIPRSYVVLVECSKFDKNELDQLKSQVDLFINLIDRPFATSNVFSIYKGSGERYMTLEALKELTEVNLPEIPRYLFKISGRYTLSDEFQYSNYDNDYMNFLAIGGDITNVNTAMYKICAPDVCGLITYFETDPNKVVEKYKGSYEQYMSEFVSNNRHRVKIMNRLGLQGLVSVTGEAWKN
jgi:hypothetical protein